MNQKITFSNKKHGKINMSIADIEAWRIYMSDDKPQQPSQKVPEIINLHPQADIEVLKKGRGRPKKLSQVVPEILPEPEPEPEPIHQHPPPVFTSKGSDQGEPEPEPQLKRRVGRPKIILFIGHGC